MFLALNLFLILISYVKSIPLEIKAENNEDLQLQLDLYT